jgi:hypothetical protein
VATADDNAEYNRTTENHGWTHPHAAAEQSDANVVKELSLGLAEEGDTPLCVALECLADAPDQAQCPLIVKELLRAGASRSASDLVLRGGDAAAHTMPSARSDSQTTCAAQPAGGTRDEVAHVLPFKGGNSDKVVAATPSAGSARSQVTDDSHSTLQYNSAH